MTQIEKTRQIEVPEKHIQKFTNPDQAREYINKLNLHLSLGENFNKSRIKANREMKVEERTKVELSEYLRSLNVDFKKGEKLDFNKALSKMEKTKEMNKDEYEMLQELKYAEVSEKLKKLSKLQEIPSLTTETKVAKVKPKKRFEPETTQTMKKSKDKKTNITKVYLFPQEQKKKIMFADKEVTKIIINVEKDEKLLEEIRWANLIDKRGKAIRKALKKEPKITIYYVENGIEKPYKILGKEITEDFKKQLTSLNDKELGKTLYGAI